ncbi:ABC transporter permease [Paenibacillus xylaniclasticus]|uniref:ABC transporter permease n=1 Tax=Paenibacillus xylaniclasticus TaxID=588083 RepID=UPI000FD84A19|nr:MULTISPECIES: ABC transporter permease [Paenibacillus]GFN32041.1 hypothetical protein PCURB6_23010 [Paenibacillus curdlanolyticus]
MYTLWTAAKYQLLTFFRMKNVILIMFGLPLLIIFLLGSTFGGQMEPAKVALYIGDKGTMNGAIDAFWHSDQIKPYAEVRLTKSADDVKLLVEKGNADFGVIVPDDFSSRVAEGLPTQWELMEGHDVERNIAARAVAERFLSEANLQQAAAMAGFDSVGVNALQTEGEFDGGNTEPSVVVGTLGAGANHEFGSVSAMQYYAASNLILFLLLVGMTGMSSLLAEKNSNTLQRIYSQPVSFKLVVYGKLGGVLCLGLLLSVFIIAFTSQVYDLDWGNRLDLVVLVCLLIVLAGIGLSVVIASLTKTSKSFQSIYQVISFVALFLSGGMVANLGGTLGDIGKFTLNYWATKGLREVMNGVSGTQLWEPVGILAAAAIGLIVLGAMRLSKVVKQHA